MRKRRVIVYYPADCPVGKKVEAVARKVAGGGTIRVYHDPDKIALRYNHGGLRDRVALIVVDKLSDIRWFCNFRPLLAGIRFVVVFTARDESMMREAFHLSPSYMAMASGGFADVAAVLGKLQTIYGEL